MSKIKEYLQAGYPVIHLDTTDYISAQDEIFHALKLIPTVTDWFEVGVWTITTGTTTGTVGAGLQDFGDAKGIDKALGWMWERKDPAVLILHNIQSFMKDPFYVQGLYDTAMRAQNLGGNIVILGPCREIPLELENIITRVDFPLPTRDEIMALYVDAAMSFSANINDAKGKLWKDSIISKKTKTGKVIKREFNAEKLEILWDAARMAQGLDYLAAENALCLSIVSTGTIDLDVIKRQKREEVRKCDALEYIDTSDNMDQIGGFDLLKKWLSKRKNAFGNEAREYGLPFPKGFLIVGPGGVGKSLCARAVGNYLKLPILRLDMGAVFRSFLGESEATIRRALSISEALAPCILMLDEIDKGLAGLKSSGVTDSGASARVIGTLLTWRAETTAPVMVVATANDISNLPSMVYRKGRFDQLWFVDLPSEKEREQIFRIHIERVDRDPDDFDIKKLAAKTQNWVGAEIEAAIMEAMYLAFGDGGREPTTTDIFMAMKDIIPQHEVDNIPKGVRVRARPVSSIGLGV